MKGDKAVITALNSILTVELTSINQYFLHARMFKNWGLNTLNEKAYKKSIKDMKQADDLIERILFLEGLPNLQKLNRLRIGEHTEEMIACDTQVQIEAIDAVKSAIVLCEQHKDFVSRELLNEILEDEEEYLDWLETQDHLIKSLGIHNYLQSTIE
ncbi:bacterioferritin [Pleionea litopenaei]|uniref:Bacterioferritin n=1 Tax=Pleionea litopenaei TaxID=3070815 RepID=A0AA51RVA7_9GAMM|nr:bacterioferritin [Pleionea sp. HL-JVS1]WMS88160.1 bacterioferritin [Pleionea sp. HL-JVS1]